MASKTKGQPKLITIPCGCQYVDGDKAPTIPCAEHRYITCGKCGGRAEITPIGVLCMTCTFGKAGPSSGDREEEQ